MSKRFIVKDEKSNYFKLREWKGETLVSTIIDSYFVSYIEAASHFSEEEAENVIKVFAEIFPNLPKLIKEEDHENCN